MNTSKPLKVVLISPPPWKIVEPWYDAPRFPRQAIGYLAGYLRQFDGFEVRVIDAKLERIGFEEVVRRCHTLAADVVGLTAFTNEIKPAAHLARLIKQALPLTTTVIGGVHVTALPVATLQEFPSFDIGCHGEGEVTFHELCVALRSGTALAGLPGLVYRQGDRVVLSPERLRSVDLDAIPFPAYDLFPKFSEIFLMSQRGCPFRCSFCMNPNGRVPRQRSIANTIAEISLTLEKYRPRRYFFGDELFTVDMDRTHILLDEMIRIGFPKRSEFWIETHVNFVNYDMYRHLKLAGCYECGLGIETGDEAKLQTMGKGTNLAMIQQAFHDARRAKLPIQSLFILGHPHETETSIRRTIDFAARLNPNTPILGVMVPYPGTEIARLAAKGEGGYRLTTDDWDEFNKQIGGALEFAGLTRQQIEWLQLTGYFKVFLKNRRFLALVLFAWKYRTAGLRLVAKLFRKKAAHALKAPLSAPQLDAWVAASVRWEKSQIANLQHVKKSGNPLLTRVITRRRVGVH